MLLCYHLKRHLNVSFLISSSSTTESQHLCSPFSQVTCHAAVSLMTIKSSRVQETPHGETHRSKTQMCSCKHVLLICVLPLHALPPVHCGTSRRVSRPQFSRATAVTLWVSPCRPTSALLCQEPATPPSNCGTSGTACAGRPSQATSQTSTPSVWVSSGQIQVVGYVSLFTLVYCLGSQIKGALHLFLHMNCSSLIMGCIGSLWKQLNIFFWNSEVLCGVSAK